MSYYTLLFIYNNIWDVKNRSYVLMAATVKFSLLLDVHDLLTFDDLISILIRIMISLMNRVLTYKHFKGYFVVL